MSFNSYRETIARCVFSQLLVRSAVKDLSSPEKKKSKGICENSLQLTLDKYDSNIHI